MAHLNSCISYFLGTHTHTHTPSHDNCRPITSDALFVVCVAQTHTHNIRTNYYHILRNKARSRRHSLEPTHTDAVQSISPGSTHTQTRARAWHDSAAAAHATRRRARHNQKPTSTNFHTEMLRGCPETGRPTVCAPLLVGQSGRCDRRRVRDARTHAHARHFRRRDA